MNHYKLVCRNADGEEVFMIEGYKTEQEARHMATTLATSQIDGTVWSVEPIYEN